MNTNNIKMNQLSAKLGFWSAILMVVAYIGWTILFGAIFFFFPIPKWTNLSNLATAVHEPWYIGLDILLLNILFFYGIGVTVIVLGILLTILFRKIAQSRNEVLKNV